MLIETLTDKHTIQVTGSARFYTPIAGSDIVRWEKREDDLWFAYGPDDFCVIMFTPPVSEGYHSLLDRNNESISVHATRGIMLQVSYCCENFADFDPSEWWDHCQCTVRPSDWVYVQLLTLS